MDELSGILYSERSLDEILELAVHVAATALQGVDAASISLREGRGRRIQTHTATSKGVQELDAVQYETDAGPCLEAMASGREIREPFPVERWGRFSDAALARGYRASWSLPLGSDPGNPAALNLYCTRSSPWSGAGEPVARLLAQQAKIVLANAGAIDRLRKSSADLRAALDSRTVVGEAIGVLMARENISDESAFDVLRRASQRTNRKLRVVAADVIAPFLHLRSAE